jgi:hypothetical protein
VHPQCQANAQLRSLDSLLPHQGEREARISNKFTLGQQSVLANGSD